MANEHFTVEICESYIRNLKRMLKHEKLSPLGKYIYKQKIKHYQEIKESLTNTKS